MRLTYTKELGDAFAKLSPEKQDAVIELLRSFSKEPK